MSKLDEQKAEIIRKVYTDPAGFGSVAETYRDAKKKDKNITYADVKQWIEQNRARKKNLKGYNSFVADRPFQEFQVDLFFMADLNNQKFPIGMLFVDIFTKYTVVVPIKSKQNADCLAGLLEGLTKMGGNPEVIYTDDEGAFSSKDFQELLAEKNIAHIITRTHAAVAEANIRTVKRMLYDRIEHWQQTNNTEEDPQWVDFLFQVILTYNNKMKHSSTGVTPSEAKEEKNYLKVKLNLELHRKNKRKYPEIKVGDKVKIYKKKDKMAKERVPVWTSTVHIVEKIEEFMGQKFYTISDYKRSLLRHEILLVN